jgi:hypothetical protein
MKCPHCTIAFHDNWYAQRLVRPGMGGSLVAKGTHRPFGYIGQRYAPSAKTSRSKWPENSSEDRSKAK